VPAEHYGEIASFNSRQSLFVFLSREHLYLKPDTGRFSDSHLTAMRLPIHPAQKTACEQWRTASRIPDISAGPDANSCATVPDFHRNSLSNIPRLLCNVQIDHTKSLRTCNRTQPVFKEQLSFILLPEEIQEKNLLSASLTQKIRWRDKYSLI